MKLLALLGAAAALASSPARAQLPTGARAPGSTNDREARTARYLETIRSRPLELEAFLRDMPKGADLHNHLSGSIYAESFLRWAAEDSSCVSRRELRIINAPCSATPDTLRAAAAEADGGLYDSLIDAMSMRNWNAARINGHDQFFQTFGRMAYLPRRTGDMAAEAASRAAAGNVHYMELMLTIDGSDARALGRAAGWSGSFSSMRDTLLARGIQAVVITSRARLDSIEARRDSLLLCGTPRADPGCGVTLRWLYQVARAAPPEQVFSQILFGFLLSRADPRFVGLNLVQPEDNRVAMRDYDLQMRMIRFLSERYPGVPVTLHAGELAPGLVPPEGLRFHIREAVEVAGARRIGHGVDVMHEDDSRALLAEMARRQVMVEVNLTSNDVILGVSGAEHPLAEYLAAGVPVALSTDDEGVARSDISREYERAVRDQGIGYVALKRMSRNGLQYAFIEGEPLWVDVARAQPVAACAAPSGGLAGSTCRALLQRSPKARLQADLEYAFDRFEKAYLR